jgi:hypothetical protein
MLVGGIVEMDGRSQHVGGSSTTDLGLLHGCTGTQQPKHHRQPTASGSIGRLTASSGPRDVCAGGVWVNAPDRESSGKIFDAVTIIPSADNGVWAQPANPADHVTPPGCVCGGRRPPLRSGRATSRIQSSYT